MNITSIVVTYEVGRAGQRIIEGLIEEHGEPEVHDRGNGIVEWRKEYSETFVRQLLDLFYEEEIIYGLDLERTDDYE